MYRVLFILFIVPFSFALQKDCPDVFSLDEYMSYEEAKSYVQTVVHPHCKKDFYEWLFSDERPNDFPKHPSKAYRDEWEGIDKFLNIQKDDHLRETSEEQKLRLAIERPHGQSPLNNVMAFHSPSAKGNEQKRATGTSKPKPHSKASKKKPEKNPVVRKTNYMPFREAREQVRQQGFTSRNQYKRWVREERVGLGNLPINPDVVYADEWEGWENYLGIKEDMTFEEAREHIKPFNLSTSTEFSKWSSSGKRPSNFPSTPKLKYYKEGWINWKHFLGAED